MDCLKCVNFNCKGSTPEDDEYPCYTCEKWSNFEPIPVINPPSKDWVKNWVNRQYNHLNPDMQKLLVSVMGYCLWRTKQTKRYGGKRKCHTKK